MRDAKGPAGERGRRRVADGSTGVDQMERTCAADGRQYASKRGDCDTASTPRDVSWQRPPLETLAVRQVEYFVSAALQQFPGVVVNRSGSVRPGGPQGVTVPDDGCNPKPHLGYPLRGAEQVGLKRKQGNLGVAPYGQERALARRDDAESRHLPELRRAQCRRNPPIIREGSEGGGDEETDRAVRAWRGADETAVNGDCSFYIGGERPQYRRLYQATAATTENIAAAKASYRPKVVEDHHQPESRQIKNRMHVEVIL
jgi:hypothetical protein